jgi:hypothetical protein
VDYPEQYIRWLSLKRTFTVPPVDAGSEYRLAWFDEGAIEKAHEEGGKAVAAAAASLAVQAPVFP